MNAYKQLTRGKVDKEDATAPIVALCRLVVLCQLEPAVSHRIRFSGAQAVVEILRHPDGRLEAFATRFDGPFQEAFGQEITPIPAEDAQLVDRALKYIAHTPVTEGPCTFVFGAKPDAPRLSFAKNKEKLFVQNERLPMLEAA